MRTRYGRYSPAQIHSTKISIQKSIFFLLLCVDPATSGNYPDINVADVFDNLQRRINGLNSILLEQPELVETMSLLEAALNEYNSECFEWANYRKLILDAGAMIMRVKEGDQDD